MLDNKIVIVTGGSRGIGKAIALEMASNGADVAICYSGNEASATETVNEIIAMGKKAKSYKCNVADFDDAKNFISNVVEDFGTIDIVVNNAGITKDGLLLSMKENDFDSVIDINLKGAFNILKHSVPVMMKKRFGRIINISSVSGVMGNPGQVNYSASKGGLISMTKSLAKELSSRNINCNAIAPGFIQTDMSGALSEAVLSKVTEQIPLKKLGKVEDISRLACYLAGDGGNYITGQVIKVDGGLSM